MKWAYIKDDFSRSGLDSGFVDEFGTHTDNDGDGFYSDDEAHFGTSDTDAPQFPRLALSLTESGAELGFPSVADNDYRIQYGDDMKEWRSVIVTATESSTTWTDPVASSKNRRFYRVVIP